MADRTTPQGLQVIQSGDPGTAINQGMPTADSTDAALGRVADVAGQAVTTAGGAVADVTRLMGTNVLDDGVDLDTVKETGRWTVFSTRTHANRPTPLFGVLEVFRFGSSASTQTWTSADLASTMFKRTSGSTGWSTWERIDPAYVVESARDEAEAAIAATPSPAGFKTVPLALTVGGGSGSFSMTSGAVRMPVSFAAPVTRFRVHVRNWNPRWNNTYTGAVSLTGLWVGAHDGSGKFTGTPTLISAAASTPADGAEWVSGWVSYPLTAGASYLLGYGWTAGTATQQVVGGGWTTTAPGDVTSNSATVTRRSTLPLDVWLEAETPATTPVIAGLGDSLSSGVGATLPVYDSVVSQYARTRGALPVHYTASGTDAGAWTSSTDHKWTRWDGLTRPDAVLVGMGSNDVFTGSSLGKLQDDYTAMLDIAKRKLSPNVYSTTLLPRDGVTGGLEDVRRAFNSWLSGAGGRSLSRDVYNIVPTVSTDDETLTPALTSDGIHLTTAGYAAVASAVPGSLLPGSQVGRAVLAAPDAAAARAAIGAAAQQDTGWRALPVSLLFGWTCTDVRVRRTGDRVTLRVQGLNPATATSDHWLIAPTGFRPQRLVVPAVFGVVVSYVASDNSGSLQAPRTIVSGTYYWTEVTWHTLDTFPATLPGTPA